MRMNILLGTNKKIAGFFKKFNMCSLAGYLIGLAAGSLLTLHNIMNGGLSLGKEEIFYVAILLTIFTFFIMIILLGIFLRLRLRSFALGLFLNCAFTCSLTVLLVNGSGYYIVAWFIGMIVGVAVGSLLCWLNSLRIKLNTALGQVRT